MVTDIRDYRKHCQLKRLNVLVKELLEVRQYLKYFGDLNLPNYQAMIVNVPEGVDVNFLKSLHQRQQSDYFYFFELKEREDSLKEAINRASDELDKIL
ncbi:abnormal cell lineage family protein [Desulforamulus aquiferis]|uniref:Abnormal cell lineage family protein n=1 Tax=Desulforamulus aquiferis TaxID=1397668 RepID=A0AAW7ZB18_9FIRM|nr:abnormal cell lineage family protein [Desulforamulus aquiferis]MDO7785970.1 abnormal cell lineage family protein [Desulforamulus aquiferis]RYD02016.1 hypothetical protein N752_26550 [Desulforamulus aquiferis]